MVEAAIERYGTLDILVNNAGVRASIATILELAEEEWDRTFDIDAKGSWLCSKNAIPWMQRHGGGSMRANTSETSSYTPSVIRSCRTGRIADTSPLPSM